MYLHTLRGALVLAVGIYGLQAMSPDIEPIRIHVPSLIPSVVENDCGAKPVYASLTPSLRDEWYAYGDCSGDYGPIDGAE